MASKAGSLSETAQQVEEMKAVLERYHYSFPVETAIYLIYAAVYIHEKVDELIMTDSVPVDLAVLELEEADCCCSVKKRRKRPDQQAKKELISLVIEIGVVVGVDLVLCGREAVRHNLMK